MGEGLNGILERLPPESETLSGIDTWKVTLSEVYRQVRALVGGRVRRDHAQVEQEYDQGSWRHVLEQQRWLKCCGPEEYVIPDDDTLRLVKIGNRLVRLPTAIYYRFRLRTLCAVLDTYAGDAAELAELGCGAGQNLFSLAAAGSWHRLRGYDISENGVRAGRAAAEHFGLENITFDQIDLVNRQAPAFGELRGSVVFTYYCLEQLKYHTRAVIENLLRAQIRRAIHIEPTFELLRPWEPADLATYLYVRRKDYQDNIVRTLRALENEGRVRVLEVRRLFYSPSVRNDPTLVVWEPVS